MYSDMLNNDFPSIRAVSPPTSMVGTWTGSMGPYLSTLRLDASGTGLLCSSWNGKDSISRIKFDGQQIRSQDGGRLNVARASQESMAVTAPYYGGADYSLRKDGSLTEASYFCAQQLR